MANKTRYREWITATNDMIENMSTTEQLRTIEARISDLLQRRNLNASETERIRRLLRDVFSDQLQSVVDDVFERYQESAELIESLYADDLGVDVSRQWDRIRAIERTTSQEWGQYQDRTIERLTEITRESLLEGETGRGLQARIEAEMQGKAQAHAKAIAETQVSTYGRALKAEQSRKAGIQIYEYVGPVRSVTRPFCRALAGTSHTREHIGRMRNGNREPVVYSCGGWRCVHSWEPDPFADSADAGSFQTPDPGVVIRTTTGGMARYQLAKVLNP